MNVIWSPAALDGIKEIMAHIAIDNPDRAVSFARDIANAGEAIADMPRAFPLVTRLEHLGVRKRSLGRYLIFYRLQGDELHLLHVVHGARDYVRALFPEA